MTKWSQRLDQILTDLGMTGAELARRLGVEEPRVRKWRTGRVDQPRKDMMAKIAEALDVRIEWLRDGQPPVSRREATPDGRPTSDEIDALRSFGDRMRAARIERMIGTPEAAVRGLAMTPARWRALEDGRERPTLIDLQVVAERLRTSLDWLVIGAVVPLDRPFAIRPATGGDDLLHESP